MFRVRMVHMGPTAVNCASAKMVPGAGKTTAFVYATRDGWATIATMCVQKDFMENIAWNSVRARHPNSYVMRRVGAFAVWAMMESIASCQAKVTWNEVAVGSNPIISMNKNKPIWSNFLFSFVQIIALASLGALLWRCYWSEWLC